VTFIVAILGLELLVLVHEAGHFFVARWVGMTPKRFYVGFPPALVKVRRKGIEYGLGSLPLGGFVSLPGMNRPAPADVDMYFGPAMREEPDLTPAAQAARRALETGDTDGVLEALNRLEGQLDELDLSSAAARAAKRGIRDLRDGLGAGAYWRQAAWKRISVSFAGPAVNLLLAIALFTALYVIGSGGYRLGFVLAADSKGNATSTVHDVLKDYPAGRAGLRPGDRILAINGRTVSGNEIHKRIVNSHGRPLVLVVARNGEKIRIGPVRPHRDQPTSVLTGLRKSLLLSWEVVKGTGVGLWHLVSGQNRKELTGTVGIVQASSTAASEGVRPFLTILGLISLSLGVFNLLPLLPLDGGHILLSTIEAMRRRALGRAVYERFAAVGIALVLLLAFIVLTNDISRLGSG
jgi:regulator of sigma E protease